MRIAVVIGACIISVVAFVGLLEAGAAQPPAGKATFLVIYRPGPAWLPNKPVAEQPLKEHFRYMLSLHEKGLMTAAGPFTDDTGGAVVLAVADEAEARAAVANDPAVKSKVFVHELHPWRQVPWEQHSKQK